LVILAILLIGPLRAALMRRARIKVVVASKYQPKPLVLWETEDGFRAYMLAEFERARRTGNALKILSNSSAEVILQAVPAHAFLSDIRDVVSTYTIAGQERLVDAAWLTLGQIARREGACFLPK
jgi:hypothetical protein